MTLEASIVLDDDRAPDGTLRGTLTIGIAQWRIEAWRKGGDAGHILFRATELDDGFVADFVAGKLG